MVNTIGTFDERLSLLQFFTGVERFQKIQGKNKTVVLGASGTMGTGIGKAVTEAGSGIFMQDINASAVTATKTQIHRGHASAVKAYKLSEAQQKYINRAGLVGPPVVFGLKEPFSQITEAHKEERNKAKEIVDDFLGKAITNSRVRQNYTEATLVIEAGPESLPFKQNVFEFFNLALKTNSILATNTSSLKVSEIADRVSNPENVVGLHFFNPADRNPLVEIIATEKTSPEVIEAMRQLVYAMGKEPIVCWKDSEGAIANRILVGVLNEVAKIAGEGLYSIDFIDQVFLETFYEKQIGVKTKKAQNQFKEAPKLEFFKDEAELYNKIRTIDEQIEKADRQGRKGTELITKLFDEKEALLKQIAGKLNQKKLYASIVDNHATLGSFFTPAPFVKEVKEIVSAQLADINAYLEKVRLNRDNLIHKFKIAPYRLEPMPVYSKPRKAESEDGKIEISNRLQAAYIAIAAQILNEGLASAHDIELAVKLGFKWNEGPIEKIRRLGIPEACMLIAKYLPEQARRGTGIALPDKFIEKENISGVRSYVQNGIGFLELGRLHIQNLQQTQNSLDPVMLKDGIKSAMEELQAKGIKTVVIKSQGGGIFCSGADLAYAQSFKQSLEKIKEFVLLGKKVMQLIHNSPLITIALINGPAVGGGAELASACDYRIMADGESYVAFPEVGLGLIPEWMGTEYFPAIVGKDLAKALICNARKPLAPPKLTASDAKEVGFADAVVNRSELHIFLADVLKGNVPGFDLSKKPEHKQNYSKNNYSDKIRQKFGIEKGFKHIGWFPGFKKRVAKEAERFIDHSDDPEYSERERTDDFFKKLHRSFIKGDKKVQRFVKMAQSRFWAPLLEKLGIL